MTTVDFIQFHTAVYSGYQFEIWGRKFPHSTITKMTMFTKIVDICNTLLKAVGSTLAFYIVLQAAGAAQV